MNQNSNEDNNTLKTFTQEEVNSIVQKRLAKESEKLSEVQTKYQGLKQYQEEQEMKQVLINEGFNEKYLGKITKLIDKDRDIGEQLNELKEITGFTKQVETPKPTVFPKQEINTRTLNVSGQETKQDSKPDFTRVGKYRI